MDIKRATQTLTVALSLVYSPPSNIDTGHFAWFCLHYLTVPLLMCILCCDRDREHKLEACLLGIGFAFGRTLVAFNYLGYLSMVRLILVIMPWILILVRKAIQVWAALRHQQQGLVHDVYQNTKAICVRLSHMDALR